MTFLKFLGCFGKALLGFAAFLGGAIAVLLLGLPYSVGRGAVSLAVEEFNDTFEGRLDVDDSHLFDVFGRQAVEHLELRDPRGGLIARGSVEASSISGWMRDGLDLQVHVEEAHLVRGPDGVTNLELALTPRDTDRGRAAVDRKLTIDGEAPTANGIARLLYGAVQVADVSIDVLEFEDHGEPPCAVEARGLTLGWTRRPGRSAFEVSPNGLAVKVANGAGDGGQHLGVRGRLASGTLDLELWLDGWNEEDAFPSWTRLEVELGGANSHALDPWLRRAGLRGTLETDFGATLGIVVLEAFRGADGPEGTLRVKGNGVEGRVHACWSAEEAAFLLAGEEPLGVRFGDGSAFAGAVVPALLPFVAELAPEGEARSRLSSDRFLLGRGEHGLRAEGELRLELATRTFRPAPPFDALEELAAVDAWTVADEPLVLRFADERSHFEVAHEGEIGAWVVHGARSMTTGDLDAIVRLPGSVVTDGEPTTIRVREVEGEVVVEREDG